MKSKLIRAIIACVVVIGISFGGYYAYKKFFVKTTVSASVVYYTTTARTMDLSETIEGTGAAYAAAAKDVTPDNNGTLSGLSVKIGDTVTAGQTLFTVSSSDLEKGVTSAENNLEKQELTLSSDESAQKVDANKVEMDKLSVSDAQAQLDAAEEQLANMTVKAPISGVVTAVNNANGDNVQSGGAVLTIQNLNSMRIKLSVDELDISKVKTGQTASIKFDAVSGKTYAGKVLSVAETGSTSNNVTTYDVDVSISSPSGIKIGMNGTVTITVESKKNALVIPAEALIEKNGQDYVRVENANTSSTANSQLVQIKIGLQTQNYIEVTSGLTEGETLLVQLPSSSTTNSNGNKGGFGNDMGGFGGGNMGGFPGNRGGNRGSGTAPSK